MNCAFMEKPDIYIWAKFNTPFCNIPRCSLTVKVQIESQKLHGF